MHLVESFALNTGLQISKPFIFDKFIPLSFQERYITLQPYGKFESRKYDYWDEVIDVIAPALKENNIKIIQLGSPDEKDIFGCHDMRGKTDFNQVAYLIKNSLLHVGIDSFGIHLASGLNKKIVGLYCNMYPSNSGPYWSDSEDVIILEPDREKYGKPSYSSHEDPKTINTINAEDIALGILKQLDLHIDYPYKTLRVGKDYRTRKIELIPAMFIENWRHLGVDSLIVRMDHYFHEENLANQLRRCPCSIVTDKPINLNLLKKYKSRINEFVYFVDEDTSPKYFEMLRTLAIPFYLMTTLSQEGLDKIKLNYLDVAPIIRKEKKSLESLSELKDKDLNKIYYKTSTFSIFQDDIYASNVFADGNEPIKRVRNVEPLPVINDPDFWDEVDSYLLLEKTS